MENPLLEIHESGNVRQVPIGNEPLTIGRHSHNRLVLGDNLASRFHCLISKSRQGYILRDLNSSNGTLLNGKPSKLSRLRHGDTVTIGQTRMVFVAPNGEASADGGDELAGGAEMIPLEIEPVDIDMFSAPGATKSPPTARPAPPRHRPPAGPLPTIEPLELEEVSPTPAPIDLGAIGNLRRPPKQVPEALTDDDVVGEEPLQESDLEPEASDDAAADVIPELLAVADPTEQVESLVQSLPDRSFLETDIALVSARGQLVHPAGDASEQGRRDAVGWLRLLLLLCARGHGTDLHFEPKGPDYVIRVRIDASMVEVCRVSNALGVRLSALVKVLSEIDIAQKNAVQEGHFSARVPGGRRSETRRIDYRVSFAPSVYGQKLVVRVLDASYAPLHIRNLQLPTWMQENIERVIRQDAGMVLVCGPTGSGKTTTLYALVRGSDVEHRNVVTIEDPVEIQLEGVTQIPVDETQDRSFSALLRSTLRQDPDVILIGEIRDAETARIAMQAAITGHLVFSTVHTQNTVGTIFRLVDLGVEPYLVAQALQVVVAQRLVRQLCRYCKAPVKPTPEQLSKMGPAGKGVNQLFMSRGCARCFHTGYSGRRAIFELLSVTEPFRELIAASATVGQFHAALSGGHFQRLHDSGYDLVAQGLVPFDEIDRAIGRDTR